MPFAAFPAAAAAGILACPATAPHGACSGIARTIIASGCRRSLSLPARRFCEAAACPPVAPSPPNCRQCCAPYRRAAAPHRPCSTPPSARCPPVASRYPTPPNAAALFPARFCVPNETRRPAGSTHQSDLAAAPNKLICLTHPFLFSLLVGGGNISLKRFTLCGVGSLCLLVLPLSRKNNCFSYSVQSKE